MLNQPYVYPTQVYATPEQYIYTPETQMAQYQQYAQFDPFMRVVSCCREQWVNDMIQYHAQQSACRDGFIRNILSKNRRLREVNDILRNRPMCGLSDLLKRRPVRDTNERLDESSVSSTSSPLNNPMVRPTKKPRIETSVTCDKMIRAALVEVQHSGLDGIVKIENYEQLEQMDTRCNKVKKFSNMIPAVKRLIRMIGMNDVKADVFKLLCFYAQGLQNGEEINHIMITGEPGTGKTDLANVIADVFLSTGHLADKITEKSQGKGPYGGPGVRVLKRADLIGGYLGQTAIKTQEILDSMAGGVVILDEAYQLGHPVHGDSYSKECIDCITQNLTLGNFLFVIAGYEDSIRSCLFGSNRGLERRFTNHFKMKKYSDRELMGIFMVKAEQCGWKVEPDAVKIADFTRNMKLFKNYGGDVVHLLDECKVAHSFNVLTEIEVGKNITRRDFEDALAKFLSSRPIEDESWRSMYT